MKTEIFLMLMKPGFFKMKPHKTLKFKGESYHDVYDDNENIADATNKCEKEFKEREEIKMKNSLKVVLL